MQVISTNVVWRDVDGDELLLYERITGRYHCLNGIGSEIWRKLAEGVPVQAIVQHLSAKYDAPADMIAQDVDAFISASTDLNLLRPADAESTA